MISVVHTGGYAVFQVKHRRDVNLKGKYGLENVFLNLITKTFPQEFENNRRFVQFPIKIKCDKSTLKLPLS